jgi:hypothetical protein
MSILIFALIIVILIALLVWAVDQAPLPPPTNSIIKLLIIVIGVLVIAQRAGLL